MEVGIANKPGVKDKVAAFVTLSGVVQGSRLVSLPHPSGPGELEAAISGCTAGGRRRLNSMSPEVRKAFLAEHPNPLVPTYSVASSSHRQNTSTLLLPCRDDISQYGNAEDSQMIAAEAIYPGSSYLGLVTRDHWAIAIRFGFSSLINKNDFPRPQLFKSVLRFVSTDLRSTR